LLFKETNFIFGCEVYFKLNYFYCVVTVIVKRQIASLSRRQLYRCEEAFSNEINAYRHLAPLLTAHSRQQLFPVCHIAESQDRRDSEGGEPIIVLQDLKALGFRMKDRLAGLELNDCLLVMKVSEWKTNTSDLRVIPKNASSI